MKRRTYVILIALIVSSLASGGCDTIKGVIGRDCDWSLERLAAQVVVVPVDQSNIAAVTPAVTAGAGGVILFGRHTPPNLGTELATLVSHAPDGRAPVVMADEEGGSVQRLRDVVGSLPSARWMADNWSFEKIKQTANTLGTHMKKLGVTMDLAPVLDLDAQATVPDSANAVGSRSFGSDPVRTAKNALAFAEGLQTAGITPVVKHFPGLGGAAGNTDYQPAHTLPWDQLQKTGLQPFKAAIEAGLPAVMLANAVVPGLTNEPASVSPQVVEVLRQQLNFKGLIMTDTLTAGALSASGYTPEQAAVLALRAGSDMLLYGVPSTAMERFGQLTTAIVTAVNQGQLPRDRLVQAVNAVLAAKQLDSCGS